MELQEGDKVDLIIGQQTALGFTVLINEEFEGLLFKSDIYKPLEEGLKTVGYIKKIREDEKIDVSLRPQGFKKVIDSDAEKIYQKLKDSQGSLPLNDKSSPESIKFHFEMSKKAFKKALGNLYKEKKINITSGGIELVK